MEIKNDTVIYNAAAFRTLSNGKLVDLLKQMPGVEVGDNGSVKVNGKEVSQITVGGRTFFMGDNSVTLNNLPATVVNKVKVMQKESEAAEFWIRRGLYLTLYARIMFRTVSRMS